MMQLIRLRYNGLLQWGNISVNQARFQISTKTKWDADSTDEAILWLRPLRLQPHLIS